MGDATITLVQRRHASSSARGHSCRLAPCSGRPSGKLSREQKDWSSLNASRQRWRNDTGWGDHNRAGFACFVYIRHFLSQVMARAYFCVWAVRPKYYHCSHLLLNGFCFAWINGLLFISDWKSRWGKVLECLHTKCGTMNRQAPLEIKGYQKRTLLWTIDVHLRLCAAGTLNRRSVHRDTA